MRCSPSATGPSTARSCAGWAATAGSGSAGPPSSAAAAWARWSTRSLSARRPGPTCRCRWSPCRPSARRCRRTEPPGRRTCSCLRSWPARCTSRSGIPSPRQAPTWPRCGPGVRDGDSYVVNGQKIFTTGAHDADYIWLACRTDPDAPRHKGISILIVDTTDPGFSWTPIITHDGAHHVNATYYSDVRVPVTMRVGEENAGWRLVTTQLNHERVALGPAGRIAALYDRVRDWAEERSGPDGRPLLGMPDVRRALAETYACLRINELLNWQVAVAPTVDVADASATKVFGSERLQRIGQLLEDVVGRHGDPADEDTAELLQWLDTQAKRNTVLTFGGGVNEIQRELIATAGLGLPRVPR